MEPTSPPPPGKPTEPGSAPEETAQRLLTVLRGITADGRIPANRKRQLADWLADARRAESAGADFLPETLHEIVAAGTVSESDFIDVYCALERRLPVSARRLSEEAHRQNLPVPTPSGPVTGENWTKPANEETAADRAPPDQGWHEEPMSDAQLEFIKRFRGSISPTATKGEAANLIDRLLRELRPTHRQMAILSFWNRLPGPGEGAREVLAWIEPFLRQDPDRARAWQLFRREHDELVRPEEWRQHAAGVGPAYLARVKQGGEAALPRPSDLPTGASRLRPVSRWWFRALGGALPAVAVLAIVLIARKSSHPGAAVPATEPPAVAARPPSSPPAKASADPTADAVLALKLTGIVDGKEPRALIDGRLYLVGDSVDLERGIKLVWIDVAKQSVDFVDTRGRIYHRSLLVDSAP